MDNILIGKIVHELKPVNNNPRNSEGAFIELKDGTIMFAYSSFIGENWNDDCPSNISAIFSTDGGETFSTTPIILVSASTHSVENIMSVSLLRMNNGDLGLFYIVKQADSNTDYVLCRSRDDGKSFYTTIKCISNLCKGYYIINNDRVIRTSSNRIIIPAALHRSTKWNDRSYFDGRGVAYFYYSDDDGYTWNEAQGDICMPHSSFSNSGLQEPGVEELSNGILYCYMRTDMHCQYESISIDGGIHWSTAQPSKFTSPLSPLKIKKSPFNNKYYAIWNPIPLYNGREVTQHGWGRTPLVIAVSQDGINWSDYSLIENDPDVGYCYPAIHFNKDGSILVAYCSGGEIDRACLAKSSIKKIYSNEI